MFDATHPQMFNRRDHEGRGNSKFQFPTTKDLEAKLMLLSSTH